jgi:hypothetical protein
MIACDRSREVRYILSLYEQMFGLMLIFIHEGVKLNFGEGNKL